MYIYIYIHMYNAHINSLRCDSLAAVIDICLDLALATRLWPGFLLGV